MILIKAPAAVPILPSKQVNDAINLKKIHFCLIYRSLNILLVTKSTVLLPVINVRLMYLHVSVTF